MSDGVGPEVLVEHFAGQGVDHDSAAHFGARLHRRLVINRCADCARWHHPPKPICPSCWSTHVETEPVAGTGTIHLLTFLHQGPPVEGVSYDPPHPIVTVDLDEQEGLRITATAIASPEHPIAIGARVALTWIERAGAPVLAFRVVDAGGTA